jgi:hypothetical protein
LLFLRKSSVSKFTLLHFRVFTMSLSEIRPAPTVSYLPLPATEPAAAPGALPVRGATADAATGQGWLSCFGRRSGADANAEQAPRRSLRDRLPSVHVPVDQVLAVGEGLVVGSAITFCSAVLPMFAGSAFGQVLWMASFIKDKDERAICNPANVLSVLAKAGAAGEGLVWPGALAAIFTVPLALAGVARLLWGSLQSLDRHSRASGRNTDELKVGAATLGAAVAAQAAWSGLWAVHGAFTGMLESQLPGVQKTIAELCGRSAGSLVDKSTGLMGNIADALMDSGAAEAAGVAVGAMAGAVVGVPPVFAWMAQ